MPRNDQPFRITAYNTDQFVDPITGFTVHDDGSPTYTQPQTGIIYVKNKFFSGQSGGYASYRIELIGPPINGLITEDGTMGLVAEDGSTILIQE